MRDGQLKNTLKSARGASEFVMTRVTSLPPRRIRKGISPLWFDFKRTGADQVGFLVELADLQPTDRVLDMGCGVGRIAIPLTEYLGSTGGYDGFDVLPYMIDWCTENITSKHPNFRFHVARVATSMNTEVGGEPASKYKFPFDTDSFDVAYAGSLFTHLTPDGAENYLRETVRTLKPGGRLVATFNMYNTESMRVLPAGRALTEAWPYDYGVYRTQVREAPEANIAYDEGWVRDAFRAAGLRILEPIRPDGSYSPARAPKRVATPHLWYTCAVIAVRDLQRGAPDEPTG